jgi:hypothetical protein
MDPNACWLRFLLACAENDREDAHNAILDLEGWLSRGGIAPEALGISQADKAIANLCSWLVY